MQFPSPQAAHVRVTSISALTFKEPIQITAVIARSESNEAIHLSLRGEMDCFAEPVIRRAFARPGGPL
jgi:hypothetical protein